MDRSNFYFKQKVRESELDQAFTDVATAISKFIEGVGLQGILAAADVTEHAPQNFTVDVTGPSIIYDQNARRISWSSTLNINCALDELGGATAVVGGGNERWISIFAEYTTAQSDPRTDGYGATVYFRETEGYQINVVAGAEAPAGTATKPNLRADQILLADVLLYFGQTVVANADISFARTQYGYVLTGTPTAISTRSLSDVLQQMLDVLNAFDVSSIAAPLITDSPNSLAAGTIETQLTALLALINDNAALLDRTAGNTFTTGPQKVDIDDATVNAMATTKTPADMPGFGSNVWKLWQDWSTGAGLFTLNYKLRLYVASGQLAYGPTFAISENCYYDPSTSQWSADNTSVPAMLFVIGLGNVRVLFKAVTTSAWNDTFISGWDVQGSTGQGSMYVSGEYNYQNAKTRTKLINLAKGQPFNSDFSQGWKLEHAGGSPLRWESDPAGATVPIFFPIELPSGATLTRVDVMVNRNAGSTGNMAAQLKRNSGVDFGTPTTPTTTDVATAGSTGSGLQVVSLTGLSEVFDNDAKEYFLAVYGSASGGAEDLLTAIMVTFTDPTLRND